MKKRTISLALAVALSAVALPTSAMAAPPAATSASVVTVAPATIHTAASSVQMRVHTVAIGSRQKVRTPLNLRKAASTGSRVLTVLKPGTIVKPKAKSGVWAKVTVGKKTGWAHTGYLATATAAKSTTSKAVSASYASTNTKSGAKAYAKKAVAGKGWASRHYSCLVTLWNRESGWNIHAANSSGAYGIPQALPGRKMGSGWRHSAVAQINWGLKYIKAQYGSPCGALAKSNRSGWY